MRDAISKIKTWFDYVWGDSPRSDSIERLVWLVEAVVGEMEEHERGMFLRRWALTLENEDGFQSDLVSWLREVAHALDRCPESRSREQV